jgi:hypothetical protein
MLEMTVNGAGAASGGAGLAGVPDPELIEQATRRTFTAEHELRILQEANACTRSGEVGEKDTCWCVGAALSG